MTLLLTVLSTSKPDYLLAHIIPLPSRLKIIDKDALDLRATGGWYPDECHWKIFQDFLDSNNPLALDERRYAVAALSCLKILFGHSQRPVAPITWFSQHSRALMGNMEDHSQWLIKYPQVVIYRRRVLFYWHLRTRHHNKMPQNSSLWREFFQFERESEHQNSRSNLLQFLLPKSGYSNNILDFARYSVFRFGYLPRNHPTHMKRAIFALAKYIERVTGEMAEVRACESIWGHDRWFTAQ